MTLALCVVGNGRLDYLHRAVVAAMNHLPIHHFDHFLMVDDSGDPNVGRELARTYPDWYLTHHGDNQGMAAAVQTGFDMCRTIDASFVFWLEEDMLLTRTPPVIEAVETLAEQPDLAQICFRREPVDVNPTEMANNCVLKTLCDQSTIIRQHDMWTEYDGLFSLNPCVIPCDVIAAGWDPGNEAGMTSKLVAQGYTFGSWGHPGDGQSWVRHIGHQRGAKWQL